MLKFIHVIVKIISNAIFPYYIGNLSVHQFFLVHLKPVGGTLFLISCSTLFRLQMHVCNVRFNYFLPDNRSSQTNHTSVYSGHEWKGGGRPTCPSNESLCHPSCTCSIYFEITELSRCNWFQNIRWVKALSMDFWLLLNIGGRSVCFYVKTNVAEDFCSTV